MWTHPNDFCCNLRLICSSWLNLISLLRWMTMTRRRNEGISILMWIILYSYSIACREWNVLNCKNNNRNRWHYSPDLVLFFLGFIGAFRAFFVILLTLYVNRYSTKKPVIKRNIDEYIQVWNRALPFGRQGAR